MTNIVNHCNLTLKKTWDDCAIGEDHLIEVALDTWTMHGYMHQEFYTSVLTLVAFGEGIFDRSFDLDGRWTFAFDESGYHDSVVFDFMSADNRGVIPIVIDMRVLDNPDANARCQMMIEAESGMLEHFGTSVQRIARGDMGSACSLNPDLPVKPTLSIADDAIAAWR